MPWENKGGGGGPWGGGGGGNGGGSGGGGPWGRGGGGQGPKAPDLEEIIRLGQDRFKGMFPGGSMSGWAFGLILLALLVIWLATGLYRVQPDEQGVVLRFGKWVETTQPGLNWHLPYPIETVETPSVERINAIDIGFRSLGADRARSQARDIAEESLMVTGDQNIIDINFTVQWKIADAGKFLFQIREPEATVKIVAESAMREIIGRTDIQPALTEARQDIEVKTRILLQSVLNEYDAGIEITQVQLQNVAPPAQVIDAFDDVQRARQDLDRLRNEADAYRNDILPRARGEAQVMIQQAQGYRERLKNEAEGEAQRFIQVYDAYRQNPAVARRRMYLETMQNVFSSIDKVIMDQGARGVVPYLPLDQLRSAPQAGRAGTGTQ